MRLRRGARDGGGEGGETAIPEKKKKKKNKERGKILMAILSSLESHHTRGGLRTPKRKQYE